MRALVAAALAVAASAQSAELVWQQSVQVAVYTSAAIALHNGATPTFATATWLNPPIEAEVFNVSDNGTYLWAYTASNEFATFQVVQAHRSTGKVDTVVAEANFVPPSSCFFAGFNSRDASGTPAWKLTVPECDGYLLYDDDINVDISENGAFAAFSGFANNSAGVASSRVWAFNAQTGQQVIAFDTQSEPRETGVAFSETGEYLAFTYGDSVYVFDTSTGKQRDVISTQYGIPAVISVDGNYVVSASPAEGYIFSWNASTGHYVLAQTVTVPGGGTWYPEDIAVGSGKPSSGHSIAAFGWINDDALQARVTVFDVVTGAVTSDIKTATNAKLQTSPTVAADQDFVGICLWGDNDDVYTIALLRSGSSSTAFTYVTPGSMFGVDVAVDSASSTATTVYLSAAGKHVPANEFGNGGDAYVFKVSVPN